MIFGSVCSGIEAASVAWKPLGWTPSFLSEIEPFPRAVLAHHYPEVELHGDFTTAGAGDYEPIDLLVGGTPCQSFSIAGLRGGMADARGNLALEYLRLADRLRPRWLVWENVPGVRSSNGGRDFGAFLGGLGQLGYGWAYRSLDAQYFGLAQRRERVFVVGYLGDWRRAASVLFEPASLRWDNPPRRQTGEGFTHDLAPCIGASGRGFERTGDTRGQDAVIAHSVALRGRDGGATAEMGDDKAFALRGSSGGGDKPHVLARCLNAHPNRSDGESETFVTHALRALIRSGVRRLTPGECEKLQGFPLGYTAVPFRGKPAADGPRYKALGNSMAVPVMAWIGRRIAAEDSR